MNMLLIILVVYLVVAIVAFMLQLFLNGSFDQSKEPVKASFKWPINLIKIILTLILNIIK